MFLNSVPAFSSRFSLIALRRLVFMPLTFFSLLSGCSVMPPQQPSDDQALLPDTTKTAYSKSYRIKGKTYSPMKTALGYKAQGLASWYGAESGNFTASGERFDPRGMTAAHKTLPIPSKVRVTNLRNGRSVDVLINDRGPFKANRLIDLSQGAAEQIGMRGLAEVTVEYLGS
ncbi:septal ring lytic transglycosylase RlpA family protein [Methylomonas sp. EbA]|uniref:Endolytic peptidoglycan transglycosylase RlpA n=2 Tax=Methylomonas albis TaxID=1854563 RepID=A0ABR9D5K8_9GAMM|nr:septal ring lytic transglycosylase RlpA family protein [Methylomonas albis]